LDFSPEFRLQSAYPRLKPELKTSNSFQKFRIKSNMRVLIFIFIATIAAGAQTRTVTNSDLEKFRQERLKAEEDYRNNYAKRGMPSPEEIAKINEQRRRELEAYSSELRERREQNETSIIERANVLRSQIASVNSQIAYLRSLSRSTFNQSVSYWSYAYRNYGYPRFSRQQPDRQLPTNLQTVTDISRMYPNSTDVYNRSIGNYAFQNQRPRGGYYGNGYLFPIVVSVGNSNDVETQLIYLEQLRAGLMAEWRGVEEDARRAEIRID
jgi:hypothetical protein